MAHSLRALIENCIDGRKNSYSFLRFFLSLSAVIVVRTVFEEIIEQGSNKFFLTDFYQAILFYAHYYVSWLTVFGSVGAAIFLILRTSLQETLNLVLWGSLIILIVPIIDLIATQGEGGLIIYAQEIARYPHDFLNFLNPFATIQGVSVGVRCEVGLIAVVSFAISVWHFKKSYVTGLLLAIVLYTLISLFGYLPALHKFLIPGFNADAITHNSVTGVLLGQCAFYLYIGPVLLLTAILYVLATAKVRRIVHDLLQPERVVPYVTVFLFGFLYAAYSTGRFSAILNIAEGYKFACGLIALLFLFVHAKLTNDIHDVEIDEVSNPDRSIASHALSKESAGEWQIITAALSLLFSVASERTFWMYSLAIMSLSWLYSAPPFRFRRFYPIGTLILSLVGISVFLAGSALILTNDLRTALPNPYLLLLVWICYLALAHLKDYKDIEGDKKAGVVTLFTLVSNAKVVAVICPVIFAVGNYLIAKELKISELYAILCVSLYLIGSGVVLRSARSRHHLDRLLFILAQLLMLILAAQWVMSLL